jgi:hypothetical protein
MTSVPTDLPEDLLRHSGWLRRFAAALVHDEDVGADVARNRARDLTRHEARRGVRERTAQEALPQLSPGAESPS